MSVIGRRKNIASQVTVRSAADDGHADRRRSDRAAEAAAPFGRFDILFFLICTIVGVDTVATVAKGGGQAFTWMVVFAVMFFVPQALLFAELGAAFPQGGGPYYWTRLAFGHLAGAVNNFLYWITNPVWIGGSLTITCIAAVEVFFDHGASYRPAALLVGAESLGVPLPGETILIAAAAYAGHTHQLSVWITFAAAAAAAIPGDNIRFRIGDKGVHSRVPAVTWDLRGYGAVPG